MTLVKTIAVFGFERSDGGERRDRQARRAAAPSRPPERQRHGLRDTARLSGGSGHPRRAVASAHALAAAIAWRRSPADGRSCPTERRLGVGREEGTGAARGHELDGAGRPGALTMSISRSDCSQRAVYTAPATPRPGVPPRLTPPGAPRREPAARAALPRTPRSPPRRPRTPRGAGCGRRRPRGASRARAREPRCGRAVRGSHRGRRRPG